MRRAKATRMIFILSALFLLVACAGLFFGAEYITDRLMQSGESTAIDIALLVKNNFAISDSELAYMKSLTFNEMEVDPINARLMDVGNGVRLNAAVTNVYIVAPLGENEYRYCRDRQTADFLGVNQMTPLDGVWLLNGRIGADGKFEPTQREDIFRYTRLDADQKRGMETREPFGTFTSDSWGSFITGYAPIYTTEGGFVGLLGIDMDPDRYQNEAQGMILLIIVLFALTAVMLTVLFIVFYIKYARAREGQRKFDFYSRMSDEMRTPMNGILGMAELSRDETDPETLRRNFKTVEESGKYILELINKTLNYRGEPTESVLGGASGAANAPVWGAVLRGKRILICEDNHINAEIARRLLEHVGCTAVTAENGRIGLERYRSEPERAFDAVLMDIRMPELDGIETAKRIRASGRTDARTIPIIALTANSYEEDRRATRDAGMNAHLTKPVDPDELYKTLSDAIASAAKVELTGGERR